MEEIDDPSIMLGRAIAGDRIAMAAVLREHHDAVHQYIQRHLPRELVAVIDPSDVLQDVYFEACRLFPGFQPQGEQPLLRWLLTISRHRMIDHWRRHRARPRNSIASGDDQVIGSLLAELAVYRRTPSQSARSHEFMAAFEKALGNLPDNYRQAVVLRYIDRLDGAEVASRMSKSPQAVYLLCCRALKLLREELKSASLYV